MIPETFFSINEIHSIMSAMDPKIYLAPMSGITDLSFRLMSRSFGARHCFFEMLDARALIYDHPKNRRLLKTLKKDSPLSAQLLGMDPAIMLEAARKLLGFVRISSLDINSACPAKKVLKKGAGAALLKNPASLGKIVKKLASALPVPVTVKVRIGLHKRNVAECLRIAEICQDNGAACIFIHGRTVSQGYSGDIDYESIKRVKSVLKIPVFGSGNIFNPFMAKKMFDETGCDGILVARGALGNPWIFKNIERYLTGGPVHENPALSAKKKVLKTHLAYIEKYKEIADSNKTGFMGKVAMWYLRGIPEAAKIRDRISRVRSYRELKSLIGRI